MYWCFIIIGTSDIARFSVFSNVLVKSFEFKINPLNVLWLKTTCSRSPRIKHPHSMYNFYKPIQDS